MTTADQPLALAYVRVSTTDQAEHGASLDAQTAMLREEAQRRGWRVEVVTDEGKSGKSMRGRDGLVSALARLDSGEASFLLATRLDRLSRSVADFATLLDRSQRKGWGLVLLSPNLDTSDAAGRFTAHVLASAAEYERALISARTREGLAQRRAEGVRLGRPQSLPLDVVARIVAMHREGASLRGIGAALTADGIPTARGGAAWYPATVRAVLASQAAQALA